MDYTQLQSNIVAFSKRSDLASLVPTFVALAEAKINTKVRMRAMRSVLSQAMPAGTASISIPAGCVEVQDVSIQVDADSRPQPLSYIAPTMWRPETSSDGGTPTKYTVRDAIYFNRTNAEDIANITANYLAGFDIATDDTNALLTAHPQVYLYAALSELFLYVFDEQRAGLYAAKTAEEIAAVNAFERRSERLHGATMRTEVADMTGAH